MDLRPYIHVQGANVAECKGGPFDKLGMYFDEFPAVIILDGHRYEYVEIVIEHPEPDVFPEYHYRGKEY